VREAVRCKLESNSDLSERSGDKGEEEGGCLCFKCFIVLQH